MTNTEKPRITYDYNNLLDTNVIPEGATAKEIRKIAPITVEDIDKMLPELAKAKKRLASKWGKPSKMLAWT